MHKISKLHRFGKQINQHLHRLFDQSHLNALARAHKFVQRKSSQLKGSEFIDLLCFELFTIPYMSYEAMIERLQELRPGIKLSVQALFQRITSKAAVVYCKAVFSQVMETRLIALCEGLDSDLFRTFPRVFMQDASQMKLHEKLAPHFRGAGGSASSSALELDLCYDLKAQKVHSLEVYEAAALQKDKPDVLALLNRGDLLIRDLGYFCLKSLAKIAASGAFFLSRLFGKVSVYLKQSDADSLDIVAYLNEHFAHLSVINLTVYMGAKERLKVRLICYRLPDNIINQRRRTAKAQAKKKGRTLEKAYLDRLSFSLYVTNVPKDIWPAEKIATIYRIRWQIELMFKHWKSLLHLDLLKGTRPERILCLVYGRLICLVILSWIYAVAEVCAQGIDRESSVHKLILWLKRRDRLVKAIRAQQMIPLIEDIEKQIPSLCKQKRNRKTTRELIREEVLYLDTIQTPKKMPEAA